MKFVVVVELWRILKHFKVLLTSSTKVLNLNKKRVISLIEGNYSFFWFIYDVVIRKNTKKIFARKPSGITVSRKTLILHGGVATGFIRGYQPHKIGYLLPIKWALCVKYTQLGLVFYCFLIDLVCNFYRIGIFTAVSM